VLVERLRSHDDSFQIRRSDDLPLNSFDLDGHAEAITHSRRTIFIIDENRGDSLNKAIHLFGLAYKHAIEIDRTHDILIIFAEKVSLERIEDENGNADWSIDLNFAAYAKQGRRGTFTKHGKCLDKSTADEARFWEELYFFMPHRKKQKQLQQPFVKDEFVELIAGDDSN